MTIIGNYIKSLKKKKTESLLKRKTRGTYIADRMRYGHLRL